MLVSLAMCLPFTLPFIMPSIMLPTHTTVLMWHGTDARPSQSRRGYSQLQPPAQYQAQAAPQLYRQDVETNAFFASRYGSSYASSLPVRAALQYPVPAPHPSLNRTGQYPLNDLYSAQTAGHAVVYPTVAQPSVWLPPQLASNWNSAASPRSSGQSLEPADQHQVRARGFQAAHHQLPQTGLPNQRSCIHEPRNNEGRQ